jgi:hypothetical protein
VLVATAHHDDCQPVDADITGSLLDSAGDYLIFTGPLIAAPPLLERSVRIRQIVHGREHPVVAASQSCCGFALAECGDFMRARPLLENASRSTKRPTDPTTQTWRPI